MRTSLHGTHFLQEGVLCPQHGRHGTEPRRQKPGQQAHPESMTENPNLRASTEVSGWHSGRGPGWAPGSLTTGQRQGGADVQ